MVVHRWWCTGGVLIIPRCDHSYDQVATGPARPGSHRQEAVDCRRCIGKEEEKCEENFIKYDQIAFNKTVDGKEEEAPDTNGAMEE